MNVKLELDAKSSNSEISRVRVLVDRLRSENASNNKEFLRLAELPHKIDPLKVQRLIANIKAKKDNNLKHKLFYKWRQRYRFDNLKAENRNTLKFGNWKGFVLTISDVFYHMFVKAFPRFTKNDTNSFILFRNQIQGLESSANHFMLPFKAYYLE